MSLKVKDILKSTNGNLIIGNLEQECDGFIEDTRKIKSNGTYVAIKGEKVDGNIFWEEAFKNGANAVILNKFKLDPQKIEKYKKTGKNNYRSRRYNRSFKTNGYYKKKNV